MDSGQIEILRKTQSEGRGSTFGFVQDLTPKSFTHINVENMPHCPIFFTFKKKLKCKNFNLILGYMFNYYETSQLKWHILSFKMSSYGKPHCLYRQCKHKVLLKSRFFVKFELNLWLKT